MYLHNPSFDSPETRTDWDDSIAEEISERQAKIIAAMEAEGLTITAYDRSCARTRAEREVATKYAPDFG
jgi:hypothetical protein